MVLASSSPARSKGLEAWTKVLLFFPHLLTTFVLLRITKLFFSENTNLETALHTQVDFFALLVYE